MRLLDSYEHALEGYTYLNCFGPSGSNGTS